MYNINSRHDASNLSGKNRHPPFVSHRKSRPYNRASRKLEEPGQAVLEWNDLDRVEFKVAYNYHGFEVWMRSFLEAKWARLFTLLEAKWVYELAVRTGFCSRRIPDFWLPDLDMFVSIKPEGRATAEHIDECKEVVQATGKQMAICVGAPYSMQKIALVVITPDLRVHHNAGLVYCPHCQNWDISTDGTLATMRTHDVFCPGANSPDSGDTEYLQGKMFEMRSTITGYTRGLAEPAPLFVL